MPFSALGLSPVLCSPLARLGYHTPTPVQAASIPIVLRGRDLLARAQTGTGKTAAFGLPMIDRLLVRTERAVAPGRPRGLVLVPTRELAAQVHTALATYGAPLKLRTAVIVGGVPMPGQLRLLRRGVDVLVATPGRLIDHLERRSVDLSAVEILTLDEADRMLDMGFLPQLRRVLAAVPRQRQTLLLSATLSADILRLSSAFTHDPEHVDLSVDDTIPSTVTHVVHPVTDGRKGELLRHVLSSRAPGQALVFCRTKRGSNRVAEALGRAGLQAAVIHGNKSQSARQRALGSFKSGRVAVLVATDLAARGLDISRLPLVINYDMPLVAEDYVHRVGRTGRAGVAGRAVSLVSASDQALLRDIQRLLPSPLEHVVVEGFEGRGSHLSVLAPPAPHARTDRSSHRAGRARADRSRPSRDGARRRRPAHRTPTTA